MAENHENTTVNSHSAQHILIQSARVWFRWAHLISIITCRLERPKNNSGLIWQHLISIIKKFLKNMLTLILYTPTLNHNYNIDFFHFIWNWEYHIVHWKYSKQLSPLRYIHYNQYTKNTIWKHYQTRKLSLPLCHILMIHMIRVMLFSVWDCANKLKMCFLVHKNLWETKWVCLVKKT